MVKTLEDLERYRWGEDVAYEAQARPNQWVPVYQLRPLELVAYLIGIPFYPYNPVIEVLYNSEDKLYRIQEHKQLVWGPLWSLLRKLVRFVLVLREYQLDWNHGEARADCR